MILLSQRGKVYTTQAVRLQLNKTRRHNVIVVEVNF